MPFLQPIFRHGVANGKELAHTPLNAISGSFENRSDEMPADELANDRTNESADEPKLKPAERAERTNTAFRQIVDKEKSAEDAKTARLKKARLKRDAGSSAGKR